MNSLDILVKYYNQDHRTLIKKLTRIKGKLIVDYVRDKARHHKIGLKKFTKIISRINLKLSEDESMTIFHNTEDYEENSWNNFTEEHLNECIRSNDSSSMRIL